jgi:hypothetical protein
MGNPWEIPLKWKLLVIKTGKPKWDSKVWANLIFDP